MLINGRWGNVVGKARCAVPARVQRAERMFEDVRITAYVAPLNAAPDGAARHPYPRAASRSDPGGLRDKRDWTTGQANQ